MRYTMVMIEILDKVSMKLSEEEEQTLRQPVEYSFKTDNGQIKKQIIEKVTRRK